jgi:hypothetical protein
VCAVQKEVKTGQAVAAERQVERAEVKTEGDSEDLMKDLLGGDDDDEVEFSGMSHDVSAPLSLTHSHTLSAARPSLIPVRRRLSRASGSPFNPQRVSVHSAPRESNSLAQPSHQPPAIEGAGGCTPQDHAPPVSTAESQLQSQLQLQPAAVSPPAVEELPPPAPRDKRAPREPRGGGGGSDAGHRDDRHAAGAWSGDGAWGWCKGLS